MDICVVDTTLRDGEQKAGIALKTGDKVQIAGILDHLGIFQIEAGTPAMGGEEKRSVSRIAGLGLKCKVSAWNRLNLSDILHSMECEVDIVHISVPVSDIQIETKLGKSREWVMNSLRKCVSFCMEKNFAVTIGLEDASRADSAFMLQIIASALMEGAQRVRYADTVGISTRNRIFEEIRSIRAAVDMDIEMHAHNDLGMAVANTLSAVKAGAAFVDCTIGGIGERAGNCDMLKFIQAAKACLGICNHYDMKKVKDAQKEIMGIIF